MSISIIKFNGGLGNQIFQFAFYLYCKANSINVEADNSIYSSKNIHGGFLLDELFPQNNIRYTDLDTFKFTAIPTLIQKAQNKVMHHNKNHYYEEYFGSPSEVIPFLKRKKFCYLEGWWQDIEYIKEPLQEIRSLTASLENNGDTYIQETVNEITCCTSVSLHVRRGDYLLSKEARELYGNICTSEYYKAAICHIKETYPEARLFIFSDDIVYCKNEFKNKDTVFISAASAKKAYIDMLLMSLCKHHIIANSSFSWWGAMLSNKNGTVIMPHTWDNTTKRNRLIIPGSVCIDNKGRMQQNS